MGPLFSLVLIASGSAAVFLVAFIPLRMFLSTSNAIRHAGAFVVGMGAGAALSVGLLALFIGTDASLKTRMEVAAYLATIAIGALTCGATLSYCVGRKFR